MQILRQYIQNTLKEGKVEKLSDKFPDIDVKKLAQMDPSPTNKYLEWMIKQTQKGHKFEDIGPTVSFFHDRSHNFKSRDIYSYRDLKDLEDEVKIIASKPSKKDKQIELKGNAKKIYEDENQLIIRPDDRNASICYGKGTEWCITMMNTNYWSQYTDEGVVFYFVFNKELDDPSLEPENKNPFYKLAFAFYPENLLDEPGYHDGEWENEEEYLKYLDDFTPDYECYNAQDKLLGLSQVKKYVSNNLIELMKNDIKTSPIRIVERIANGDASEEEFRKYWNSLNNDEKFDFILASFNGSTPYKNVYFYSVNDDYYSHKKNKMYKVISKFINDPDYVISPNYLMNKGDYNINKPSIINYDGFKWWRNNDWNKGSYRPNGKPAVIYWNGTKRYYDENGKEIFVDYAE